MAEVQYTNTLRDYYFVVGNRFFKTTRSLAEHLGWNENTTTKHFQRQSKSIVGKTFGSITYNDVHIRFVREGKYIPFDMLKG